MDLDSECFKTPFVGEISFCKELGDTYIYGLNLIKDEHTQTAVDIFRLVFLLSTRKKELQVWQIPWEETRTISERGGNQFYRKLHKLEIRNQVSPVENILNASENFFNCITLQHSFFSKFLESHDNLVGFLREKLHIVPKSR